MTSMKLVCLTLVAALFVVVSAPRAWAFTNEISFIAPGGNDNNPCSVTQPCVTIDGATNTIQNGGQVTCLNSPNIVPSNGQVYFGGGLAFTLDCVGIAAAGTSAVSDLQFTGVSQVIKIRNLTFSGALGAPVAIQATGSGTLILEKCNFENFSGVALVIEPTGQFNLVIKDSRISNSGSGMLIQPGSGGSVNATLEHVSITDNTGGGIKTNTANGAVTLDIIDDVVSSNGGNGINAVAGASLNIVSIKNSAIAKNGGSGVQANGANAGVLLSTTLLDQNAAGATSIVSSGNMFSYGNNEIVGSLGSGFNQTGQLH